MTDSEWELFVRSLIDEPIAKNWTQDEIAVYKKVGIIVTASAFFYSLAVTHKKCALRDKTADDPYIELPADFWKPVRIEFASNGEKLRYIQDDQLWKYDRVTTVDTPEVWMFEDGKIAQIPTPGSTATNYWRLFYLPRFTTLANLPEELHPLVAIEAVISAKSKDEDVARDLLLKRQHYFNCANVSLAVQQLQEPEEMPDFDNSEEYDEII